MNSRARIYCFALMILFSATLAVAQGDMASPDQIQKLNSVKRPVKKVEKKKPRDGGQDATVKVDGAAVYEVQNFDAPVMGYMDSGKKVKISKKLYPGIGGLGAFYKIRMKKGVFGYITDTDVEIKPGGKATALKEEKKVEAQQTGESSVADDPSRLQDFKDEKENENPDNEIYLNRYLGLGYYNYAMSEKLGGNVQHANTSMFGLNRVGPTSALGGLPLDMDFIFTSSAPAYYNKIATTTSGFMIIADMLANLPIAQTKRYLITFGLGLNLRYSKWAVTLRNAPTAPALDSQEMTLGIMGQLSGMLRITKRFALRADVRYIYEKQRYPGYDAAVEFAY